MSNVDMSVATPEVTSPVPPTSGFGSPSAEDTANADNSADGDNEAKASFFKTMRALGKSEALGVTARLDALIAPMDAIWDGSITFTPGKKGPKNKKGAVPSQDDVAEGFEFYREANAKAGKGMTSPAQQLSKFRAVAAWAAGPASWDVKTVRDSALKKHKEITLANNEKKTKKEGKQPIYSASQMLIMLAHLQGSDGRMANADLKDQPLTEQEVLSCIYKPERQEKEFVEYLNSVIDKMNARADEVGSEQEGEKLAVANGGVVALRDFLVEQAKAAEDAEQELQAFNFLKSRGHNLPLQIGHLQS